MRHEHITGNPAPLLTAMGALEQLGQIANKEARPPDSISYIDTAPEKQVVLSPQLEYLARQVGGCQTEALLALLRRLVYEAIRSQQKH